MKAFLKSSSKSKAQTQPASVKKEPVEPILRGHRCPTKGDKNQPLVGREEGDLILSPWLYV